MGGMMMYVRFTRRNGIRRVLLGSLKVMGFEELGNLIWRCQGSVVRGYMLIKVCFGSKCWILNTGYKGVVFRENGNYVSACWKDLCRVREVVWGRFQDTHWKWWKHFFLEKISVKKWDFCVIDLGVFFIFMLLAIFQLQRCRDCDSLIEG